MSHFDVGRVRWDVVAVVIFVATLIVLIAHHR